MKLIIKRIIFVGIVLLGIILTIGFIEVLQEQKRERNRPTLFKAIWKKDYNGFEAALDRGADPNARIKYGSTGITLSDIVFTFLLRQQHTDTGIDGCCGETALIEAVKTNDVKFVSLLLERGADPNEVNFYGLSARTFARDENGNIKNMPIALLLDSAAKNH